MVNMTRRGFFLTTALLIPHFFANSNHSNFTSFGTSGQEGGGAYYPHTRANAHARAHTHAWLEFVNKTTWLAVRKYAVKREEWETGATCPRFELRTCLARRFMSVSSSGWRFFTSPTRSRIKRGLCLTGKKTRNVKWCATNPEPALA